MVKFITGLIFLFSFYSFGQQNPNVYEMQIQNEVRYSAWIQEYPSQNCNPSFFWMVTRSVYTDQQGRYLFKIYFYSNSRYCNGTWASTYINGVYLYVDGYLMNPNNKYWIMFKDTYHNPYFSFYTQNPNPMIKMTWDNITIN